MKTVKFVVILASLGTIFNACNDGKKSSIDGNFSLNAEDQQAFITKYNAYVGVWNELSPSVEQSYNSMLTILDESGKLKNERTSTRIAPISSTFNFKMDNFERAIKEDPEIESLDSIGPKLLSSYRALMPPVKKLVEYYSMQKHKEDNYAQASELYTKAKESMEEYLVTNMSLGAAIEELDRKLTKEAIKEYKNQDLLLLYNKAMIAESIKNQIDPLYEIEYTAYNTIDVTAFKENLNTVVTHYNTFKDLANDAGRVKNEFNTTSASPFTLYYRSIDDFIKTSNILVEYMENPAAYDQMKKRVKRTQKLNRDVDSHLTLIEDAESVIAESNRLN